MCRNIKTLFNFNPQATEQEIRAASLQFVRKISGFQKPSKANKIIFEETVEQITQITGNLISRLTTEAIPRNREIEAANARTRTANRFGMRLK